MTEHLDALTSRLARTASEQGLVEVAWRTVDSPVGELLLAATPAGLARVAFAREGFDGVLQDLSARIGPRVLREPGRLDAAAHQLDDYFAGLRTSFDLHLDDRLSTGFRQQVQRWLPQIGYGRTASYAEVAAALGRPGASRAVGTACATNPLPLVVPCHRVLRSGGALGGYLGGLEAKQALLELEGALPTHR
ncbi:methylated-DNA--[protein]-cysteine S-methyltransferase [Luteococcus peritonei]|uniref:Methylated-DNA--protein-cysteine methyltransferase n=1 Tax=Luteococcus peritonei TaxID=88874 RepID=A0ABW4RSY7_9ACTN